MKQQRDTAGFGINACQITRFGQIAVDTGEREVVLGVGAAMFFSERRVRVAVEPMGTGPGATGNTRTAGRLVSGCGRFVLASIMRIAPGVFGLWPGEWR